MHGTNYCAFTPAGTRPMPNDFCLYQTIPASKLQAGTYRVSCLFWSESGLEGMGRLFAGSQVQYFGSPHTYEKNLTEGEQASFASYPVTSADSQSMQELSVEVTVGEGEDLTLGIRSGSLGGDGIQPTGSNRAGKFRVDYFRIERISSADPDHLPSPKSTQPDKRHGGIYNISGQKVAPGHLSRGIYITDGKKFTSK